MVPWNMYNNSKEFDGVSKNSRLIENEEKIEQLFLNFLYVES